MTSHRRSFIARASRIALALSAVAGLGLAQAQSTTRILVGFPAGGGVFGRGRCWLAAGQYLALAQRQHAALKIRNAAPPQVLVDHPQVYVFHVLEQRALHSLERNVVFGANAIAVVAVHQQFAPQHQCIAAALAQQAALQGVVFFGSERINIGLEAFVNNDGHG